MPPHDFLWKTEVSPAYARRVLVELRRIRGKEINEADADAIQRAEQVGIEPEKIAHLLNKRARADTLAQMAPSQPDGVPSDRRLLDAVIG